MFCRMNALIGGHGKRQRSLTQRAYHDKRCVINLTHALRFSRRL